MSTLADTQESMPRLYMSQAKDDAINEMGRVDSKLYTHCVMAALHALTEGLGLGAEFLSANNAGIFVADSYFRYHREQLVGNVIAVDGGIIAAEPGAFAVHLSMFNDDSGELATTSLEKIKICNVATHAAMALPQEIVDKMGGICVLWPESGWPAKLGLGPLPVTMTPDMARELRLASSPVVSVTEEYCDTHGFMLQQYLETFLSSAKPTVEGISGIHEFPTGERLGTMTIESRSTLHQTPSAGDKLQTYAGISNVTDDTCHWRYWTFNSETGEIVHIDQIVSANFDLVGRKIIPTPLQIRRRMEEICQPDPVEPDPAEGE